MGQHMQVIGALPHCPLSALLIFVSFCSCKVGVPNVQRKIMDLSMALMRSSRTHRADKASVDVMIEAVPTERRY